MMYGRGWAYHIATRLRTVRGSSGSNRSWTDLAKQDDVLGRLPGLWIFARLTLVLATFFAGASCLSWIAS